MLSYIKDDSIITVGITPKKKYEKRINEFYEMYYKRKIKRVEFPQNDISVFIDQYDKWKPNQSPADYNNFKIKSTQEDINLNYGNELASNKQEIFSLLTGKLLLPKLNQTNLNQFKNKDEISLIDELTSPSYYNLLVEGSREKADYEILKYIEFLWNANNGTSRKTFISRVFPLVYLFYYEYYPKIEFQQIGERSLLKFNKIIEEKMLIYKDGNPDVDIYTFPKRENYETSEEYYEDFDRFCELDSYNDAKVAIVSNTKLLKTLNII